MKLYDLITLNNLIYSMFSIIFH